MDNTIGNGTGSALDNNSHRQWTSFSVASDADPLQAFQIKQKPPTALLEPVELDDLHPIQSQNDVSPSGTKNDQKACAEGDQSPKNRKEPDGTRQSKKNEVVLKVTETTTTASSSNLNEVGKQQQKEKEMSNGKLLVTLQPMNVPFFWLRRPTFDLVTMPSVLASPQNRLTTDAFSSIVRTIEKDSRFVSYALCHSRMVPVWLVFSIVILLAVLASSPMGGLPVMIFAFVWLFMLITGLLFCALLQKFIVLALRKLVKEVNALSQSFRILVGVHDRGVVFIFYDFDGCREDIARQIRVQNANLPLSSLNSISDIEVIHNAEDLMLEYAQAYLKELMKLRLRFPTRPSEGVSDFLPRHVAKSHCLCQFVSTEHFHKGPQRRLAPWYERMFAV